MNELIDALNELQAEKNIEKEVIMQAIEDSLVAACNRDFGKNAIVKVNMDRETGAMTVFVEKTVVEEVEDSSNQISLEDAKMMDIHYELGDVVNIEVTPKNFGRIAAQHARSVIVQKIKEEERRVLFQHFSHKEKVIEIIVKSEQPKPIDIEKIYNEIRKDPVDAYYTKEPFTVYPSENGIDFNISIEEAKSIISSEQKEEYTIPLKILSPNVTTNMIGTEAFPDLLSTYSTKYAVSNRNRTTNLILAANKINGTVIMPGETFSYNKVVGARTISAGYKEAPIYVQGKVVDGIGGGICQITTTLYNAVLYANLEIVQRTNHQFIPSYAPASRDATVVYGAIDFQFKNNRDYPIKLVCSVANGTANFQIFGLKQDDDCEVQITAYETGRTKTAIYSEAYKILKKDGKIVSQELLSKDIYKRH